jgi:hypothetical protein
MRLSTFAFAFALALATVAADARAASIGDGAPPPDTFVLVWTDALLASGPGPGAVAARLAAPRAQRVALMGTFWVMRLLGEAGDSVVVQPTAWLPDDESPHCFAGASFLDDFVLSLYVARGDLAPVLARPVQVAVDAETRVALAAGVIASGGPGEREIFVDRLRFPLAVPDDAVSDRYRPSPHFDVAHPIASLGAGPVALGPRVQLVDDLGGTPEVFARRRLGARTAVTLRTRCAELQLVVPSARVVPLGLSGYGAGIGGGRPSLFVRPGTIIYWPDGGVAGFVRRAHHFWQPARIRDGKSCFDVVMNATIPDGKLPLCFNSDDVVSENGKR